MKSFTLMMLVNAAILIAVVMQGDMLSSGASGVSDVAVSQQGVLRGGGPSEADQERLDIERARAGILKLKQERREQEARQRLAASDARAVQTGHAMGRALQPVDSITMAGLLNEDVPVVQLDQSNIVAVPEQEMLAGLQAYLFPGTEAEGAPGVRVLTEAERLRLLQEALKAREAEINARDALLKARELELERLKREQAKMKLGTQ